MSDHSLLNNFISMHDISEDQGVNCFHIRGGSNKPDYIIVRDTRTHPLAVFTNGTKPEIMHNKESEAHNKLFANLRDKWNEADRPFVPRKWRTPESFRANSTTRTPEGQPGILHIENNKPTFSTYPTWNIRNDPELTLLLRVPNTFTWLTARPDIISRLMSERPEDSHSILPQGTSWTQYIEDEEGQGPLEAIGLKKTRTVTIADLCPKATTVIPFQPFQIQQPEIRTIISKNTFLHGLVDYEILPPYVIVDGTSNNETMPLDFHGYMLHAWIEPPTTLHELYQNNTPICLSQQAGSTTQTFQPFDPRTVQRASLLLYSIHPPSTTTMRGGSIEVRVQGTYTPPSAARSRTTTVIPFREPMSCTATAIEEVKDSDFPIIAEAKLDGNRIVVHITEIDHSEDALPPTVKYYSRNGIVQSAKFSEHFDQDVIGFSMLLSKTMGNTRSIQLDCECYAHHVVHAEIGGWINRVAISPEFRQLRLYMLSWLNLEELTTEKKRGRDYIVGTTTFGTMLLQQKRIVDDLLGELSQGDPLKLTLSINVSEVIQDREKLFSFMSAVVGFGFEGLVLYPPDRPYTFANAGLKKIKKFYDGECTVLSYKASDTDSSAIGSVFVRTAAYFAKPTRDEEGNEVLPRMVTFYVTAALRQDVKGGSMTSPYFASCVGKDFTVVCGSFSDEGVPIHARFKASLGPENARVDHR